MFGLFRHLTRHGPRVLVAGLLAGLVLPPLAGAVRPWLSELVLLLLCLNAFRIGWPEARQGLGQARAALGVVLSYQLALPLLCIAGFALFGQAHSPAAIALTLMLAAPSVTGSANMSIMLGHAPEPAFRLMILGTILLPLTLLPVFWLSPVLGDLASALGAALRLGLSICVTVALGFGLRAWLRPEMSAQDTQAVDGATTLALAVIVIGLMSAVNVALFDSPWRLAGWLILALVANLGLQGLAFVTLRKLGLGAAAAPSALVAGNRNVALFLVASSATQSESFLMFLGCYQFPMYLTPILMRPLLGRKSPTI